MARVVTVKELGGIRWQVNADFASLFITAPAPDPRRLLKKKSEIIKRSSVRTIFASSLEDGNREIPVVIKIYRLAKVGDWIKANLLGSKARKEWRITTAALERGLMTVIPVAYGERRRGGILRESYLITIRLFNCVTLEDAIFSTDGKPRGDDSTRSEIIVLLAALLRKMHDSGIYHRDLHPGNFLVEETPRRARRMYLLDLHRASVSPSLSLKKRIASLAQFNMFATISHSNSERLLFFKSYFGEDTPWKRDKRRLLEIIDRKTLKGRWRLWRSRQKRCVGVNKYFIRLSFAGLSGFARREAWRGEMAELLLTPPLREEGGLLLKESRSKAVWERKVELNGLETSLVVKHYKRKRGWKAFRYIFRTSQAIRSWKGAYILSMRNIKTVRPIAALEEKRFLNIPGNAYFIAEKISDAENLAAFIEKGGSRLRPILRATALFLRRIHQRGIYHADMKATNILVRESGGGFIEFFLTDLDHVSARLRLTRRQTLRNLSQLNKSFLDLSVIGIRDRSYFLSSYLGPYRRAERRSLWEKVARMTNRTLMKSKKKFYHTAI